MAVATTNSLNTYHSDTAPESSALSTGTNGAGEGTVSVYARDFMGSAFLFLTPEDAIAFATEMLANAQAVIAGR